MLLKTKQMLVKVAHFLLLITNSQSHLLIVHKTQRYLICNDIKLKKKEISGPPGTQVSLFRLCPIVLPWILGFFVCWVFGSTIFMCNYPFLDLIRLSLGRFHISLIIQKFI